MAAFIVEYAELGAGGDGRETHRAAHIGYRKQLGPALRLAGPLLDEAGAPSGSVVVIEAADATLAAQLAANDPYVAHGVMSLVSVRPFRVAYVAAD